MLLHTSHRQKKEKRGDCFVATTFCTYSIQCWASLLAVRRKLGICTVGELSGPIVTGFVVDIALDRFSGIVCRYPVGRIVLELQVAEANSICLKYALQSCQTALHI